MNLDECDSCHKSFETDEVPIGLMKTGCYKTIEEAKKSSQHYGWTPQNKKKFKNLIIRDENYQCGWCGYQFHNDA